MIKKFLAFLLLLSMCVFASASYAQVSGKMLEYPPKVEQVPGLMVLKKQLNAKIDYIGRKHSVDMWLASKDNATQVIFTTLDGRGLLTNGFLFDQDGNVVTEQEMADVNSDEPSIVNQKVEEFKAVTRPAIEEPSVKLWRDLAYTPYISFGSADAPVLYMFADVRCPFCKKLWKQFEPYVDRGDIQVRVVLVGILGDMSVQMGAQVLSEVDQQGAWLRIANDSYKYDRSRGAQGYDEVINNNTMLMEKWKMTSTPFSVYKNKFGKVMMLRGYTEDVQSIIDQVKK